MNQSSRRDLESCQSEYKRFRTEIIEMQKIFGTDSMFTANVKQN